MMKKIMIYLNCIKSKCFMLMMGLALLLGATSCSNEEFEDKVPDQPKELSKAELIEAALSRIPQTRGVPPFPVVMITSKKTVIILCEVTEDMTIHWEDGSTNLITKNGSHNFIHKYSDNKPSHGIYIEGSNQAIKKLYVFNNDLTFLDVTNNTELEYFDCFDNQLDRLDLAGCQKLKSIRVSMNNLSSIDVSHLPYLEGLNVSNNRLTDIDVSKNPNLYNLSVGYNQITDLDLSKNIVLKSVNLKGLEINTINNLPISNKSFAIFPLLTYLNIAHTPFDSLDLSNNPLMTGIDISGTAINQLDISNLQIENLVATDSKLTNLTYTSNSLSAAKHLSIINTPFETLKSNLYPLFTALPDRNSPDQYGSVVQGRLLTNSSTLIAPLLSYLTAKNWVVYP